MHSSVKREVQRGDIFQHFNGNLYIVDQVVTSADNVTAGERAILYSSTTNREEKFTRLETEFLEHRNFSGVIKDRFKFMRATTEYYKRCKRIPGTCHLFPVYAEQDVLNFIESRKELGLELSQDQKELLLAEASATLRHTLFLVGNNQDCGVIVCAGDFLELIRGVEIKGLSRQMETDQKLNMPSISLLNATNGF